MSREPSMKEMASSAVYNAVQNAVQEIVASASTAACNSIQRIYEEALLEALENVRQASIQRSAAAVQGVIDVQKMAYAAAKSVFREVERMENKS